MSGGSSARTYFQLNSRYPNVSNNPLRDLSSAGLSPDTAAAVDVLKSKLVASTDVSRANTTADVLAEVVEALRTLGA